jgi:dienelactone hydrolase
VSTGYLAVPDTTGPVPGVLTAREATGMNDHVKARAPALAHQVYAAFALDLYGTTRLPRQVRSENGPSDRNPGLLLDRATAALETLARQQAVDPERLGAIGFCLGGITTLVLARVGAPIRCAIGFTPD